MTGAAVVVLVGAVGLAALATRTRLDRRRRAAARSRATRALPGVVSDLARSVRGGATLEVALRDLAPNVSGLLGREVRGVVVLLDRGHSTERALGLWRRASRVDGVALLVAACRFPLGSGSGLDRALDGVSATLLDRIEVGDEVVALAAQARLSTTVLLALPPVGAVVLSLVDPTYAAVLVGSGPGRLCLVLGAALELCGLRVSRAVVRRSLGPSGSGPAVGVLG